MKHVKHMLVAVLTVFLAAVLAVPAFAAGDGTITINNAVTGHTYTAYQIFKGNLDSTGNKLSNVDWGTGISSTGKTALQTAYEETDPAKIAEKLTIEADAVAFADNVGSNVATGTTGTLSGTTYTISGLEDGYYMIVDSYTPAEGETNVTYSRYMVQLVGTATVNNKAEKPSVDKKIVEEQQKVVNSTANIGDTVTYEITSAVPDMTGYKEYYMDFSDTLSKGLTYDAGSLEVYIGETKLDLDDGYTQTIGEYSSTNGTSIAVHLKDLVSREYAQGAQIRITYTAKVNDAAVIGNTGNPNTVKLDYSNNPANSGDGTPDNNNDGVKGETPESIVNTFVTEIELTKVDGKDNTKKLAGAVFNIKGSQINKVLITGEHFVEAETGGTHYKLKDGTYTTTVPTDNTRDKYESTTQMYKKEAYATTSVQETANTNFEAVTGSDGIIKITGLQEGTYTFTEIQAPDGYNLLDSPITVIVKSNIATITKAEEFEWDKDVDTSENVRVENGVFKFTVENNSGSTLPETGGMGTTILYTVGGIMVIAGIVMFLTKRRMASIEK